MALTDRELLENHDAPMSRVIGWIILAAILGLILLGAWQVERLLTP